MGEKETVAVYARVSSAEQRKGGNIESQIKECLASGIHSLIVNLACSRTKGVPCSCERFFPTWIPASLEP